MNPSQLFRLAGVAALVGGLLRVASGAPLPLDRTAQEALWTIVDMLLSLGLVGIYLIRADKLRVLGLASFVVAMCALSFIGGPDADVFGFSTYVEGATTLSIALVGLSIAWLTARLRPLAPPLLWIASAIAAGVLGALPAPASDYGFAVGGALFGLAFAAAGLDLVQRKA